MIDPYPTTASEHQAGLHLSVRLRGARNGISMTTVIWDPAVCVPTVRKKRELSVFAISACKRARACFRNLGGIALIHHHETLRTVVSLGVGTEGSPLTNSIGFCADCFTIASTQDADKPCLGLMVTVIWEDFEVYPVSSLCGLLKGCCRFGDVIAGPDETIP